MNLIDRDELLKFKREVYDYEGHPIYAVPTGIIMRSPTVDATPIRRGRWVFERGRRNPRHCSECGFEEGIASLFYHYCPHCGADMREEENNEAD